MKTAFLFSIMAVAALAQPGQYPPGQYPPGQYPPGRYPPGQNPPGTGVPIPGRGSKSTSTTEQKSSSAQSSHTFSGVVRVLEDKSFDLETTDTRILTIQFTATVPKPAELKVGDGVDVDTTKDKDGLFQALSIKINGEIARTIDGNDQMQAEGRTAAPPTIMVRPGQETDDGDSGPPKLKRGAPPQRPPAGRLPDTTEDQPATREVAANLPAPPTRIPSTNPRQEFIEKAREAATTFVSTLPNYVCNEVTSRYVSETRVPSWSIVDVVAAEVVFEEHKETYRNVTINGKPSKKPPEESGAWSTGEFGTILANLFALQSAADFKYTQDTTIAHHSASVYDFKVVRARSSWKIWVPGQYILPAYKGSMWIDKESAHVLRIEMQAHDIPEEFPRIVVETAVDYDFISLGTPEKFLLPVHAEVLSCARGSNECDRNVIEFRNYHKFTGESTIKFNNQ